MKQRSSLILAVMIAALAAPGFAADEYNTSSGVTYAGAPLGFHGVDAVAMFETSAVTYGLAEFTAVYDGVSYYFGDAQTAAKFEANPTAYLPQFGGFCTLAVGLGKKFDGDPRYADIRDGKLYVFVNAAVFDAYIQDPEGTIAKAEAKWPEIQSVAVENL